MDTYQFFVLGLGLDLEAQAHFKPWPGKKKIRTAIMTSNIKSAYRERSKTKLPNKRSAMNPFMDG